MPFENKSMMTILKSLCSDAALLSGKRNVDIPKGTIIL